MNKRLSTWACSGLVMLGAAGCSHTAIKGEGYRLAQVIHGTVGIMGEDNRLTIREGSDVIKLSIIGEENRVVVEDGATLRKLEIVGEDNEVTCPEGMSVIYSTIGEDNRLRFRGED
jgi:hypothetical protein